MDAQKEKNQRLFKAQRWYVQISSAMKLRASKYEIVRELWKVVAVPGIMYAMNVLPWTAEEIKKLDVVQNKVGRVGLGANRYTAVEAIRGDMGWSSFDERMMKGVLIYKKRLEDMDECRWAKIVYRAFSQQGKFVKASMRYALKSGFIKSRETGPAGILKEWRFLKEGRIGYDWTLDKWKKEVNSQVKIFGLEVWRVKMSSKVTLRYYMEKKIPCKELFYDGSFASELLFKARTLSLEVNARTYRFSESGSKECKACLNNIDETVEHVINSCPAYGCERDILISKTIEAVGAVTWSRECPNYEGQLKLILGFSVETTPATIDASKTFLLSAWMRRKVIESRSASDWEEGSTLSVNEYNEELTLSADEFLEDDGI